MTQKTAFSAVIPCGGKGARMGAGENKLFLPLLGKPCLWYTLRAMEDAEAVSEVVLSVREEEKARIAAICRDAGLQKKIRFVPGGITRQDSVKNGVYAAAHAYVLVHDGARCLIRPEEINRVAQEAILFGAAAMGVFLKDTVKRVDAENIILETVPRENLVRIQTPQAFCKADYLFAVAAAEREGYTGTDECALLEKMGMRIHLTEGSEENLKLTTPDDLRVAEGILQRRGEV